MFFTIKHKSKRVETLPLTKIQLLKVISLPSENDTSRCQTKKFEQPFYYKLILLYMTRILTVFKKNFNSHHVDIFDVYSFIKF